MERPAGIAVTASIFSLAAAYLFILGAGMLASPGTLSMALGAPVLGGLELAGPYMFLLMGGVGAGIGVGLWRLHRWARWAAIVAAMIGILMLVPAVSSRVIEFRAGQLIWGGLGVIVRVMIVWYLFQETTRRAFQED